MSRFDVAMFCQDKTAILYHVETYEELVQSLNDLTPHPAWLCAVAVAQGGQQRSGTFTARALVAAGLPQWLALAPMDGQEPLHGEDRTLVVGQPVCALDDFFATETEERC